jgi:hypothetical protein
MRLAFITLLVAFMAMLPGSLAADVDGVPHLDHAFVIVEENTGIDQLIGPAGSQAATDARNINALANTYGLADNYHGVVHPSEPNYVAMTGGNYFGISDDDDYSCPNAPAPSNPVGCHVTTSSNYPNHVLYAPSLAQQMDDKNESWKGYFQTIPSTGYTGACSPSAASCLYAAKHNPFINFDSVQKHDLNKMVADTELGTDLDSGRVPQLSMIVPDQCHDMHGLSSCPTGKIIAGDTYLKQIVDEITGSKTWQHGNNAIFIVWDEDDFDSTNIGCCDAGTAAGGGGGVIPAIVITNADARRPDHRTDQDHLVDHTPYNHYSLLQTLEGAFNLDCLQNACDTANVKPMTPLLRDR